MKNTLNENEFINEMKKYVSWEYETLKTLFEYLEEYEESTGEQIEFDPIALRCEFSEYDSLKEINKIYSTEFETIDKLSEHTIAIKVNIPQYYKSKQNVSKILIQDY